MPTSPRQNITCYYSYDPMDRSIGRTLVNQPGVQRFYCNNRLSSEIQGTSKRSIFQHDNQVLAQQHHRGGEIDTALLATDRQRSVLNVFDASQPNPLAYTAYGHCPSENGVLSLLRFNGEAPDPVTGHYPLGNGYRQFNPVLMRFNSPDSWSPFGKGGLNAYGYCGADPINRSDPSGHILLSLIGYGVMAGGLVTTLVGMITEDEGVIMAGLAVAGAGAVVGAIGTVGSSLIRNRLSPTFGHSTPTDETPSSVRPPNSPDASSRQLRRPSEDQGSLNRHAEDIDSGRQSPVTAPLPANNSNAQSDHLSTLQSTSNRSQTTEHLPPTRRGVSIAQSSKTIRTTK